MQNFRVIVFICFKYQCTSKMIDLHFSQFCATVVDFSKQNETFHFQLYLNSLEHYGATKDDKPIFSKKCDIHALN